MRKPEQRNPTFSKACQNLASLLEQAEKEGEVRIKRKDGRIYAQMRSFALVHRAGSPYCSRSASVSSRETQHPRAYAISSCVDRQVRRTTGHVGHLESTRQVRVASGLVRAKWI
jgi:hypothetical protein